MKIQRSIITPAVCTLLVNAAVVSSAAYGGVIGSGDVSPANPATWTSATTVQVGNSGIGSVTVDGGSSVSTGSVYMGIFPGSVGTVTVSGSGSNWTLANGTFLYVGEYTVGTLGILNGATINAAVTYVGPNAGSTGIVDFGASGGTLTTTSFYAAPSQVTGTGIVNSSGVVTDGNLLFDATHGLSQSLLWNSAGQNVTVNFNLTGGAGDLGAGYTGAGSLTIKDGLTVNSRLGFVGYTAGSTGTATVDGAASSWSMIDLVVGYSGNGTLNISHGASVSVSDVTYVAYNPGSTGTIQFGAGSGTLTTVSLYATPAQVTGTGVINTTGLVTNGNLVFDSTHGLSQTFLWNSSVTVNLNVTSGAGDLGMGHMGNGSLVIKDGVTVNSSTGYLGEQAGFVGMASVDGPGSTWGLAKLLYVGFFGNGELSISNGGKIVSHGSYIGWSSSGSGAAAVDGVGSLWNVGDYLFVGQHGDGSLTITNGATVTNIVQSSVGDSSGRTGTVTVDGSGSVWNGGSFFTVGNSGTGTLAITNGGKVVAGSGGLIVIGSSSGGTGALTVDGPGSTLTDASTSIVSLYVGFSGHGTLAVSNGGQVTAGTTNVGAGSLLSMSVGDGSLVSLGTKTVANSGTIRLKAAASAVAGNSYTPIVSGAWSGAGGVQALGGTWNSSNHTFTVSSVANGTAGNSVGIDRSQTQRMAITDPGTGDGLYANFLSSTTTANLTLTASPLTAGETSLLQAQLDPGTSPLAGWTFTTTGYTVGDPVYLSLAVGPGFNGRDLSLWHYDGGAWGPYSAVDFSYDGSYASFTVTGFSGYAVAAAPEPASLAMLGMGAAALLIRRRRGVGR